MQDLNALPLDALFDALTPPDTFDALMNAVRREDLGDVGDVTSMCSIDADARSTATLRTRENTVVAGLPIVTKLIKLYQADVTCKVIERDGTNVYDDHPLAELSGSLRDILAIERPLLNFVGRLSGIASLTQRYVRKVLMTDVIICDTRKTTPGWRGLEKYAVRCGGGTLHRVGLYDAVLLKDNHIAAIAIDDLTQSINHAASTARERYSLRFVEVEVDTLEQFEQVLACQNGLVDIVLLDNMTNDDLTNAAAMRNSRNPCLQLEASGGITIDTVEAIAKTGIDRISVGALTHSVQSIDVGLDIEPGEHGVHT